MKFTLEYDRSNGLRVNGTSVAGKASEYFHALKEKARGIYARARGEANRVHVEGSLEIEVRKDEK